MIHTFGLSLVVKYDETHPLMHDITYYLSARRQLISARLGSRTLARQALDSHNDRHHC